MRRVGLSTVVALIVAVAASSSAAPMIAYAAAPALAIAFWRNALAVGVIAPVAATDRGGELWSLLGGGRRRTALVSVLAGVFLAVHFAMWVPSPKLTSVAVATALVSTMPVWTAVLAWLRSVKVAGATWLGIGLAVLGVVLATGADVTTSARALTGDVLALAGAFAGAIYMSLGEAARRSTSTMAYTCVCYSVCSLLLLAVCFAGGVRLVGFTPVTWLVIAGMTAGPQLLGHSLINYALRRVTATTVTVLQMLQVPGAALIGWVLLGQLPPARSLPGIAMIMGGVTAVVLGARRRSSQGSKVTHTIGMLSRMSRRKKRTTLTLDAEALDLAERVAKLRGISVSALASRAIRNEALRLGAPGTPLGTEQDAVDDEAEQAAIDQEQGRAA